MATFFGSQATGGTSQAAVASSMRCCKYTCADTATATQISIWAKVTGIPCNLRLAIYSDNAGSPNAKLAETGSAQNITSTTDQWYTLAISCALVAATNYWLCAMADSGWTFYYGVGSANQADAHTGETYPTWPATVSGGNTFTARNMDFYVDYTPTSVSSGGAQLIIPGPSVQLFGGH